MVTILYFATARESAETSSESLPLDGETTAGGLLASIVLRHPRLKPLERSIRLAVNKELVGRDASVSDRDEVAVLPPIAGG